MKWSDYFFSRIRLLEKNIISFLVKTLENTNFLVKHSGICENFGMGFAIYSNRTIKPILIILGGYYL